MTEFKQIIGRGTRVRDDYGKLFFNILDYTGSATRLFADPDFDGEPEAVTETDIDAARAAGSGAARGRTGAARPVAAAICPTSPAASSTSTAGRWRLPPTWSMSWMPTGGSFALSNSPTTRPNRSARSTPAPPTFGTLGRPGRPGCGHRRIGRAWHRLRRTGRVGQPAGRRPVRPALPHCVQRPTADPAGTGATHCAASARTFGTNTARRPGSSWTSYWRSTRPTARRSLSCPTCSKCRQSLARECDGDCGEVRGEERLRDAVAELQTLLYSPA